VVSAGMLAASYRQGNSRSTTNGFFRISVLKRLEPI
jgi:hypothetical protein